MSYIFIFLLKKLFPNLKNNKKSNPKTKKPPFNLVKRGHPKNRFKYIFLNMKNFIFSYLRFKGLILYLSILAKLLDKQFLH